ncbi:CotH kinase family protein [Aristaeella hokkaidonensis]|uniref:CotH kinase family protein n=1 Tax=Aristaeella hokkaidonensis TaxID=3046382 RepID=A0AC61NB36_9FIRM|nr:CotH kinase family protein [Aristaeella hokkaidonensis]QUC68478.1 CotH kinase family protein [Aristaeella hokkaidonensis]SNT94952.1 Fn3 associated [Aristaeella hokkaidonensis]
MKIKQGVGIVICLFLFAAVLGFASAARADVIINEVMASNGYYENGHAWDWVELYNNGDSTENLSGWGFTDSKKDLYKFTFPDGTKLKAGEYLTIWCTGTENKTPGKGDTFYADFKISSSGETLRLTDEDEDEVQKLKMPEQYGCVSYGLPSGGGEYGFFEKPTRGKKNESEAYTRRLQEPEIVTAAGFYEGSVTVEVRGEEGAELHYTTDGETPTKKSKVFPKEGLTLKKTTPLRVKAFLDNAVSSPVAGATYFIDDAPKTAIVSLISDDQYLFSKKTGILTKGTGSIPNYSKGYEYPVHIEYFNKDGKQEISQTGTMTCSGHSARINSQKSIALYARKAWGADQFMFNPFRTRDYVGYKSLLLRAANSDFSATRLRDIVASSLAEGQDILYQDHEVIQVYINGRYWGHYNLREKINKYFVAAYEGVTEETDIDNIDILARTGTDEFLQNGDNKDWLELCDFCKKNDLNKPENLAWLEERLDIDNMFTHAAFEIILGNVDFTNVRVYRVPGGKWKYLLFDVEACWRNLDPTPIEYYIKPLNAKIQGFRHEPLNALFKVPEMKARFLQRVSELLSTVFRWDNVEKHFDDVIEVLKPILPRHIERWKNMKMENWKKNIHATKYYARVRPKKIPEMLKKAMKLTNAEVEEYFGETLKLLEETNKKPEE